MSMRIAKFIAHTSTTSRRGAEKMIAQGIVAVNGITVLQPNTIIEDKDIVTINGKQIKLNQNIELYAFHKPINVMTTTSDPMGRKTIYDIIALEYKHLKYIGRLDYKTTGLLLLTNNGDFARKLTLPSFHISRTYIAQVGGNLEHIDKARQGLTIDGIKYKPMQIDIIEKNILKVTVSEGKKNEIRIVLRNCGAPVQKLHRISFGPINLGNLSVGEIRKVPQKTIDEILKSL